MFSSVSRTIPQTQQTISFIASRSMTLEVNSNFVIRINGFAAINPLNIPVNQGDTVTAVFTTPDDYLWSEFFYYKIDGVPQSFAVVNKSEYTTKVKSADAERRWFMYYPETHSLTFQTATGANTPIVLRNTTGTITSTAHVILDPLSSAVYFYADNSVFLCRVTLPAEPMYYVRNPLRDSVLVLVRGGEVYEIFLNSNAVGLSPFISLRNFSEFTGDLTYVNRLPGEDLITYLRRLRNRQAIPPATCMTIAGDYLVAGGNGTVWVVDLAQGFVLKDLFPIDEYVQNIVTVDPVGSQPTDIRVVLITQSQKAYIMNLAGTATEIYQGISLWQPVSFNGRIYIPECNRQGAATAFTSDGRIQVYNPVSAVFEDPILLSEFCPSYTVTDGDKMYVAGHDTERVLEFDSQLNITTRIFPDKVAWVSAVNGTLLGSHYLTSFKLLLAPDLFRIVEVDFKPRRGPISHIGTNIETVKTLGNDEIYGRTPINTWIWANGRRTESNRPPGVVLVEGDYVSLSYAARVAGASRTNCVIGDTAYDYDVEAVEQTYYARHIDLPIQAPDEFGIHTRSITLPRYFTPCLMSLEYGALRVNGGLYLGDTLVNPEDQVTIEIRTCKTIDQQNSVLPIFTIGARQYVIPVSINANITPVLIKDENLIPNTSLTKTVIFSEATSRADFIIPGYYDLTIKKNNVNITGNYYQQFGKNDVLVVEFNSSRKKYDQRDVYILGLPNYRFNAQNIIEQRISFLDYGNLVYPYTRVFDPVSLYEQRELGPIYSSALLYEVKEYQYQTANVEIAGLSVGVEGNITIKGIDSYFVLNGNAIADTDTITVKTGDNLALARNVLSYFDSNVTVIQSLPDPEDDFLVDVEIGFWGIVNQNIEKPPRIYSPLEITDEVCTFNYVTPEMYDAVNANYIVEKDLKDVNYKSPIVAEAHGTVPLLKFNLEIDSYNEFYTEKNSILRYRITDRSVRVYENNFIKDNEYFGSNYVFDKQKDQNKQLDGFIVLSDKASKDQILIDKPISSLEISSALVEDGADIRFLRVSQRKVLESPPIFEIKNYYIEQSSNLQVEGKSIQNGTAIADILTEASKFKFNQPLIKIIVASPISHYQTEIAKEKSSIPINNKTTYTGTVFLTAKHSSYNQFFDSNFLWQGYSWAEYQGKDNVAQQRPINYITPVTTDFRKPAASLNESRPNRYERPMAGRALSLSFKYLRPLEAQTQSIVFDYERPLAGRTQTTTFEYERPLGTRTQSSTFEYERPLGPRTQTTTFEYERPLGPRTQSSAFEYNRPLGSSVDTFRNFPLISTGQQLSSESNPSQRPMENAPESKSQTPVALNIGRYLNNQNYEVRAMRYGDATYLQAEKSDIRTQEKILTIGEKLSFPKAIFVDEIPESSQLNLIINDEIPQILEKNVVFNIALPVSNKAMNFGKVNTIPDRPLNTGYNSKQPYQSAHLGDKFVDAAAHNTLTLAYAVESIVYVKSERPVENTAKQDFVITHVAQEGLVDRNFGRISYGSFFSPGLPSVREKEVYFLASGRLSEYSGPDNFGLSLPFSKLKLIDTAAKQSFKLEAVLERPENYSTDITLPEIDRGFLWDNALDVIYGAFLTESDAVAAAQKYSNFRPYLILNTNFWSYRVLFDTGLICELPPGRYPIAWLIRGG